MASMMKFARKGARIMFPLSLGYKHCAAIAAGVLVTKLVVRRGRKLFKRKGVQTVVEEPKQEIKEEEVSDVFDTEEDLDDEELAAEELWVDAEKCSIGEELPHSSQLQTKDVDGETSAPSLTNVKMKPPGSRFHVASASLGMVELLPAVPGAFSLPRSEGNGRIGLRNLGNTCYMNSALQVFIHLPELIDYFLSKDFRKDLSLLNPQGSGGQVAEAFAKLMKRVWKTRSGGATRPSHFWKVFSGEYIQFADKIQHDAVEFSQSFLQALMEDLPGVEDLPGGDFQMIDDDKDSSELAEENWKCHMSRHESHVASNFHGLSCVVTTCPLCGYSSRRFQPFAILQVGLPAPTGAMNPVARVSDMLGRGFDPRCLGLIDQVSSRHDEIYTISQCLHHEFSPHPLDKDNLWQCGGCGHNVAGIQSAKLWKLPPVLLISLKRFSFNGVNMIKLTPEVVFPLQGLDLSNYCGGMEGRGALVYDLCGVCSHHGNGEWGHYTAAAKINQKWYKFDDEVVSGPVEEDEVVTRDAYMLCYRLRG